MKIGIIVGSVREGRLAERVARFVLSRAMLRDDAEFVLLDLKEINLPLYAEALEPAKISTYSDSSAQHWSEQIAALDGFILLVAEYNRGYTPVLKNALDYLYKEWNDKPVSFVSYSTGPIGGARAVEQLKLVVTNLRLVAVPNPLHIGRVTETLAEDGVVHSGPFSELLDTQLTELIAWARLLQTKRAPQG